MKRITNKLKIEFVKSKLTTSPAWALRALQVVYSNQTADERMFGITSENNNIGFTGTDGEFMSSLAKQYKQRGSLSPKQMKFVMTKMKKYHKQILVVMDDNKLIDCMHQDGVLSEQDVEQHKGLVFLNMV
jgi:hypothetical protein